MDSDNPNTEITLAQAQKEYKEAIDIFPALHKYQAEHNSTNLQKLCVEIVEFCLAVYASTRNEEERNIYFAIFEKIKRQS